MKAFIILETGDHCIERAAKGTFNMLMESAFSEKKEDKYLEVDIALMSDFLNSADFPALRASDERLSGAKPGYIRIFHDNSGKVCLAAFDTRGEAEG